MDLTKNIRPEILEIPPYIPGLTIEEIKYKYDLDRVIKLSSNENPFGMSELVQTVLANTSKYAYRYPRNHSPRLTTVLAEELEVSEDNLILGNGSDEIIDLLIRVRARPGKDHVLCYESAFSVYRSCARMNGVEYRTVPRDKDLCIPLDSLVETANEDTAIVFLTSPDNPTGDTVKAEELMVLAQALPQTTILAVDEAYVDFTWPRDEYTLQPFLDKLPNVVLMRTFSKAWGLAGLRLGFGIMHSELAAIIARARMPFTVNLMAEAAGIAAISDKDFYLETLNNTLEGRKYLMEKLAELECGVHPSQANFVMFEPLKPAAEVNEELLKRGVIVRHLASFGLPEKIRVSVGTKEENEIFISALSEVLHG